MEEKVDILLATYNGEKYLKEQINSILNQTYQNIRLIISDDCSQDKTREILKEYENDERVEIYYQEENIGSTKNFEFLLTKVENNIFMLSDQDDVWKKVKIEKSIEKLVNEKLDLVFGDLEIVDENLNTISKSYNTDRHFDHKIEKYISSYKLEYLYNCITGCTIAARKKLISKILPLPTDSKYVIHDYWIGLIASIYGKVGYIEKPYILYRQHGDNQVGSKKISKKDLTLKQKREELIDVKIGTFETYVNHKEIFTKELQKQNEKALDYFKMLKTKKHINFRGWTTYNKLYKTETPSVFIKNFIVLNLL